MLDTEATDHLTNDLERLQVHERYDGKDQVQVANGAGLSISHIGHSRLPGSSLKLHNILHVPHISQHLLSVYRLFCHNDVFVEFHHHFFLVKDKATRRVILHGRSYGGGLSGPLRSCVIFIVSPCLLRCSSFVVAMASTSWSSYT